MPKTKKTTIKKVLANDPLTADLHIDSENVSQLIKELKQENSNLKTEIKEVKIMLSNSQKKQLALDQFFPKLTAHLDELTFKQTRLDDYQVKMGVEQQKIAQFASSVKAELVQLKLTLETNDKTEEV